jgi:hypothetical protein
VLEWHLVWKWSSNPKNLTAPLVFLVLKSGALVQECHLPLLLFSSSFYTSQTFFQVCLHIWMMPSNCKGVHLQESSYLSLSNDIDMYPSHPQILAHQVRLQLRVRGEDLHAVLVLFFCSVCVCQKSRYHFVNSSHTQNVLTLLPCPLHILFEYQRVFINHL